MKGYIALISVLIINAIILLTVISANLFGISESFMNLEENQTSKAYYLASACTEEALEKIRESASFSGSGDLYLEEGNCTYTVTKLTGQNYTIVVSGTVQNFIRKIKITIDKITPKINVTSWQEVTNF